MFCQMVIFYIFVEIKIIIMKKTFHFFAIALLFLFCNSNSYSQTNKKDERLKEKAARHADLKEYDKAVKVLKDGLNSNNCSSFWDLIVGYSYEEYQQMSSLRITVSSKPSEKKSGDNLGDSLMDKIMGPNGLDGLMKKIALDNFLNTCKEAQLSCEYPFNSYVYLRLLTVDKNIDSNISDKAWKFYQKGESEFQKQNLESARRYYQKAIEAQSDFYKARLYLGDSYYASKEYALAIKYFREAIEKYPEMFEPRKYLVDALSKSGEYEKAFTEINGAILIYPECGMFWKMEDACALLGKKFDRHWIPRGVSVNEMDTSNQKSNSTKYVSGPWKYYREGFDAIQKYCGEDGIIAQNPITKEKYAEVYCWRYMLKKSNDPSLEFARKMETQNMLDCYVFLSEFNSILYKQEHAFVSENKEKATKYLESLSVPK